MGNRLNRYIDYKNISKTEAILLGIIKNNDILVFSVKDLRALLNWSNNRINNTIASLDKKGVLVHINWHFIPIFTTSKSKILNIE